MKQHQINTFNELIATQDKLQGHVNLCNTVSGRNLQNTLS
jgi:hypothetical protein